MQGKNGSNDDDGGGDDDGGEVSTNGQVAHGQQQQQQQQQLNKTLARHLQSDFKARLVHITLIHSIILLFTFCSHTIRSGRKERGHSMQERP